MFINIFMQLLNVISIILITKIFNPSIFGKFSYMIAQSLLLSTIGDLGIRFIAVRNIARDNSEQNKILSISLISIVFSNVFLFFPFLIYNHYVQTLTFSQVGLVSLCSFVSCLSVISEFAFMGRQKMGAIAISNTLYSSIWFILIFTLNRLNIHFSLETLFTLYILTSLVKPITLFIVLRKNYLLKLVLYNFWYSYSALIKQSLPFFALVLVALPANYLTNNFLEINSTISEVGIFSLAKKFTLPISMILGVMLNALFPNLSILWHENKTRFNQLINKGVPIFIIVSGILAFAMVIIVGPTFSLFFSKEYYDAVFVSRVQVWYAILMAISSLIGTIWAAMNKEKLALKAALINTLINTPILWFGSKYGSFGLSIAYVISTAVFMIILWIMFLRANKVKIKYSLVWLIIILLFSLSFII
jgi:O-antigen/teichoic acid export membrane protein